MDQIERLRDLIARVEAATGPCPKLDVDIADMLRWPDARWTGHARPYTASLDAAVTLVPDGLDWTVDGYGDAKTGCALVFNREESIALESDAATPALALCAAALRAGLALAERRAAALSDLAAQDGELLRDEGSVV